VSTVFFAPATLQTPREELTNIVATLFKATGLPDRLEPGDLTAIKIHFGEAGNRGYIAPDLASVVAREVAASGAKPFFTDTNTLYVGRRANAVDHLLLAHEHGFTPEVLGAPVLIADGLLGNDEARVKIQGRHFQEVRIARDLAHARALVGLHHFTGHLVTGFGAAIKNLGMGGASRAGKLHQHAAVRPRVNLKKCTGCAECLKWCSTGAIRVKDTKASIDSDVCIGCGQCLSVCPAHAVQFNWDESPALVQQKMAEHALGVLQGKERKSAHLTFLTHMTAECDCLAKDDPLLLPDLGILASTDPVAIDQAALDLVEEALGAPLAQATGRSLPNAQIAHAEAVGLGSARYELVTLEG
jgi:hypothetical protein